MQGGPFKWLILLHSFKAYPETLSGFVEHKNNNRDLEISSRDLRANQKLPWGRSYMP